MKSYTAIIVEDELQSRNLLSHFIKKYCPRLNIKGAASNIEDAEVIIQKIKPDILFLDIQINNNLIFEMLDRIDIKKFRIIFTTAYKEYAIKAIKADAIDYLLKPIDIDSLKIAVNKAIVNIESNHENISNKDLEYLMEKVFFNRNKKIAISSKNETVLVYENNISFLASHGKYTIINLKDNKEIVSCKNIGEYEKILTPNMFFRVHHSYIINLNYLEKIKDGYCELINGTSLPMSIRKGRKLKDILNF